MRRGIHDILAQFSFPLAEGVRWMPDAAKPLFDETIKRKDAEARDELARALGLLPDTEGPGTNSSGPAGGTSASDPDYGATNKIFTREMAEAALARLRERFGPKVPPRERHADGRQNAPSPGGIDGYLESQRDRIVKDANFLFQEFHEGQELPREALDEIFGSLKKRLDAALGDRFFPKITYTAVALPPLDGDDVEPIRAQAAEFFMAVARYPRAIIKSKAFTDGSEHQRASLLERLRAMDICNDVIVRDVESWSVVRRAKEDLAFLDWVETVQVPLRAKCAAMVDLMAGKPVEWIEDRVDALLRRQASLDGPGL